MTIGKIEIVPIREAFPHEAHNFTLWLEDNIDALSDRLGFELTVEEREKSVGSFNVDLLCTDERGEAVIIENQLERTDHSHLGQLMTYLVNLDAKVAIWVATEIRPEHQRVIDWLNEMTSEDMAFYAIMVEAIRISDSPYAPLFTVLVQPDEQTREIGEQKKELAERHIMREEFWKELLQRSQGLTKIGANRSPSRDHWLGIGAGRSGLTYNYLILIDSCGIGLSIDVGDATENKSIFDELLAQREAIEDDFGDYLEWRRMDDKQSSRIVRMYKDIGGLRHPEKWEDIQKLLIDAMIRFDKAFRNRIRRINI